jgi:hypothetical protein
MDVMLSGRVMEVIPVLRWNALLPKLVMPVKYWNSSKLFISELLLALLKADPIEVTLDASMSVIESGLAHHP